MARLPKGLQPLEKSKEPKRARSSYFIWCDEQRTTGDLAGELAGKSMAVASRILSARWKPMTKAERAPYEEKARVIKEKFYADQAAAAAAAEAAGGVVPDIIAKKIKQRVAALNAAKRAENASKNALPSGWRATRDHTSGVVVYINVVTNRATWRRPTEDDAVKVPERPKTAQKLFFERVIADGRAADVRAAAALWKELTPVEKEGYKKEYKTARAEHRNKLKKGLFVPQKP